MTDASFQAPSSRSVLAGTVTYRCHQCGEPIHDEAAFVDPSWPFIWFGATPPDFQPLSAQTRTYHRAHAPKE